MWCRGVRGAITVGENSRQEVLEATRELLQRMIEANDIRPEDVCSAIFTTTPDINAEFPALAARQMGWHNVALLCAREIDVPGALPKCIRVLIHVNTTKRADEIVHVYLRGAKDLKASRLAPDLRD